MNRKLTLAEDQLIRWMLQHGTREAEAFIVQLDKAEVTPYRCPCGCASLQLSINGAAGPSGALRILADFLFGSEEEPSGIFVFEKSGVLAGLEVYGLAGDAPKTLPPVESLRPFS